MVRAPLAITRTPAHNPNCKPRRYSSTCGNFDSGGPQIREQLSAQNTTTWEGDSVVAPQSHLCRFCVRSCESQYLHRNRVRCVVVVCVCVCTRPRCFAECDMYAHATATVIDGPHHVRRTCPLKSKGLPERPSCVCMCVCVVMSDCLCNTL